MSENPYESPQTIESSLDKSASPSTPESKGGPLTLFITLMMSAIILGTAIVVFFVIAGLTRAEFKPEWMWFVFVLPIMILGGYLAVKVLDKRKL